MIFKVGDEIIDTDKVPVALIFKDKDEAAIVGGIISNIKNGNTAYPVEENGLTNGNWWFMTPGEWTLEQQDAWSVLSLSDKEKLDASAKIQVKPRFEL